VQVQEVEDDLDGAVVLEKPQVGGFLEGLQGHVVTQPARLDDSAHLAQEENNLRLKIRLERRNVEGGENLQHQVGNT